MGYRTSRNAMTTVVNWTQAFAGHSMSEKQIFWAGSAATGGIVGRRAPKAAYAQQSLKYKGVERKI